MAAGADGEVALVVKIPAGVKAALQRKADADDRTLYVARLLKSHVNGQLQ